jgi:myo-inositol-1(or 4)-monophosphatase
MHPLLTIAVRAARRAGEIIARSLPRLDSIEIATKGRNDFVSEVDRNAEQAIIEIIHQYYPHHAILGEEGGAQGEHDIRWVIDPLDGTTNFLHGLPHFAVSIACEQKGQAEIAVVYDVMSQELFTAVRGGGAQLDSRKIRVSKARGLEGCLLATGFPYRSTDEHLEAYIATLRVMMQQTAGVRRPGAAALDLAYVAAGRVDGFWEIGLQPWDTAAGKLLVVEAGGRLGTLSGADYDNSGNIIAGTPRVYEAMVAAFAPLLPESLRQ